MRELRNAWLASDAFYCEVEEQEPTPSFNAQQGSECGSARMWLGDTPLGDDCRVPANRIADLMADLMADLTANLRANLRTNRSHD